MKSLRTVALLAMFSQDSVTVSNIQSCMKSMSIMEPDLILTPVLERAFPALEALVEVCVSESEEFSLSNSVLLDSSHHRCHQSARSCRPSNRVS